MWAALVVGSARRGCAGVRKRPTWLRWCSEAPDMAALVFGSTRHGCAGAG